MSDDYRTLNRASWDERAPAHAASPDYAFDRFVAGGHHFIVMDHVAGGKTDVIYEDQKARAQKRKTQRANAVMQKQDS